MKRSQVQKLEAVLENAKIPNAFWPGIIRGVDDLEFVPDGYVVLTNIHRDNFRSKGYKTKDLDEWLDNNTSGQFGAIVTSAPGINAIWCFEDLGDAAMFKLMYGVE
jgi:hypothetical protein